MTTTLTQTKISLHNSENLSSQNAGELVATTETAVQQPVVTATPTPILPEQLSEALKAANFPGVNVPQSIPTATPIQQPAATEDAHASSIIEALNSVVSKVTAVESGIAIAEKTLWKQVVGHLDVLANLQKSDGSTQPLWRAVCEAQGHGATEDECRDSLSKLQSGDSDEYLGLRDVAKQYCYGSNGSPIAEHQDSDICVISYLVHPELIG